MAMMKVYVVNLFSNREENERVHGLRTLLQNGAAACRLAACGVLTDIPWDNLVLFSCSVVPMVDESCYSTPFLSLPHSAHARLAVGQDVPHVP